VSKSGPGTFGTMSKPVGILLASGRSAIGFSGDEGPALDGASSPISVVTRVVSERAPNGSLLLPAVLVAVAAGLMAPIPRIAERLGIRPVGSGRLLPEENGDWPLSGGDRGGRGRPPLEGFEEDPKVLAPYCDRISPCMEEISGCVTNLGVSTNDIGPNVNLLDVSDSARVSESPSRLLQDSAAIGGASSNVDSSPRPGC